MVLKSTVALLCAAVTSADVYLHNPRGSNNRLDDQNRDRGNGNRLFDSQNNNRGGANVGSVYYYAGSKVEMEWGAQHTCGHEHNHCEIVVQAMCNDRIRDGTTKNTIPIKPNECYNMDCDTDVRFGRHESVDWYHNCEYRQRNKGLFTASQNLNNRHTAKHTRQNPNGARRGLECPEERDYYPYWHPSPWKDVAILTNEVSRCASYQEESQNVKERHYCKVDINSFKRYHDGLPGNQKVANFIPITEAECGQLEYEDWNNMKNKTEKLFGEWTTVKAHDIATPECQVNVKSRDNSLSNVAGGQWAGFTWTVPDWMDSEQCVLRLRYNITTYDLPHFDGDATLSTGTLNASMNGPNNPKEPAKIDIGAYYGMASNLTNNGQSLGNMRGYEYKNNPEVRPFNNDVKFQLAINTAQFGRTFQDRTHVFAVRKSPLATSDTIHNVQVRGKRGNIVQTFPGTEYDFTPNNLDCMVGHYVHFQWTGSNNNPNNNAGQGRQGSDRSNIVPLRPQNYAENTKDLIDTPYQYGNSYPVMDVYAAKFAGLSGMDMEHLAILNTEGGQFRGDMEELDDAGTYFDLGPRQCTAEGIFNYLSTRNNNFSNRSQKGKITVSMSATDKLTIDNSASARRFATGELITEENSFIEPQQLNVKTELIEGNPTLSLTPVELNLAPGMYLKIALDYSHRAMTTPKIMKQVAGEWMELPNTAIENGQVTGQVNAGGEYKVMLVTNGLAVFAIIGVLVLLLGAGFGYWKWKKNGSHSPVNN